MDNSILYIKVGHIGDEGCNHLWVYADTINRICEKCGRTEMIIPKTYDNIYDLFYSKRK